MAKATEVFASRSVLGQNEVTQAEVPVQPTAFNGIVLVADTDPRARS